MANSQALHHSGSASFSLLNQQEDKSRLWLQGASVEDWNTKRLRSVNWVDKLQLSIYCCIYIEKEDQMG